MNKRTVGAGLLLGLVAGTGAGLVLQGSGLAGASSTPSSARAEYATATAVAPEHHDGRHDGPHDGRRGGPGRGERGARLEAAATALGMPAADVRTALRDGSTLAEVATEQGVPVQAVVDALVAEVQTRLDEGVAEGRLTADEAAAKLAEATERITDVVNNGRPERRADGEGPRHGGRGGRGGDDATGTSA